jgi:hypothetical protein
MVRWNIATGPWFFAGTEKIFLPGNEIAGVIFLFAALMPN